MTPSAPRFRFIDLFAGIGGFHAVMKAFGGECVYAVEIDPQAANVYATNWGHAPNGKGPDEAGQEHLGGFAGDITLDADSDLGIMNVPAHDVLCAGFPCQPFSKSGAQRGMEEARGTLFFNIASIIQKHHPSVVLLENVRNLIGPRHAHEWEVIIRTLRQEGYHVSAQPAIFSPHLLPAELGGTPQVRERVFITATYAPHLPQQDVSVMGPPPVATMKNPFNANGPERRLNFSPSDSANGWNLFTSGVLGGEVTDGTHDLNAAQLSLPEKLWIDAWDDFTVMMRERTGVQLSGFPYWADSWLDFPEAAKAVARAPEPALNEAGDRYEASSLDEFPGLRAPLSEIEIDPSLPDWKKSHLRKNYAFFTIHAEEILAWAWKWGVYTPLFPASRRKLEWQAQDAPRLWNTVMHLRPSGIRAKRATYLPALVAINQTSIVGELERRLTPRETARLQGLPDHFVFPDQPASATYKQMGNGVAIGAVQHVFREHLLRDRDLLIASENKAAAYLAEAAHTVTPPVVTAKLRAHRPAGRPL